MRKGSKHTEGAKIKCGLANRGKKLTEEHKRKISENNAHYWLGKEQPRMRGENNPNKSGNAARGKPRLDVRKRMLENNPNKGKFGKDHPCYKEVKKHPFHKSIRELYKYRQWRSNVFKRDNFKCVLCGKTGYVEADHHPVRFIKIIQKYSIKTLEQAINCKELWDINNGRTLCRKCHLANFSRK